MGSGGSGRYSTMGLLAWALAGLVVAGSAAAGEVPAALEREWPRTDFSRATVPLAEIQSGGPPKDGIPAIDRPRFESFASADRWLHPQEPVIALEIADDARAYPLQILIYHEIVNDQVGGRPVAVTFCPLCNASIVFDRRAAGRLLDFGTTGRLRKSDLVMYDRQTESWWQQFTGEAIVGHYAGTVLRQIPSGIVGYEDFKRAHPRGQVLSRATGFSRPYGINPYRGYDRIDEIPFLFAETPDPRLPAMARVLNVSVGARHRLYPLSELEKTPVVNDILTGEPFVVFSSGGLLSPLDEGIITSSRTIRAAAAYSRRLGERVLTFEAAGDGFIDRETGSRWNLLGQAIEGPLKGARLELVSGGVHFAFAWLAFHPDSEIYRAEPARAARER
jgi:hypothetical protein